MPDKKRCFVDTNIWLYAFIESKESGQKSPVARAVIERQNIFVSTQVINEVCVNLIKKAGFSEEQISELIESFYEDYPVVEIDSTILLSASKLRRDYQFSYWDSLIVASALSAEVEILYSEDMQNNLVVEGKLKIINPFEK
jgi:predicted nucleic acid-binding protein